MVAGRCCNDLFQDFERDAVHLLVSAFEVGVQEMLHSRYRRVPADGPSALVSEIRVPLVDLGEVGSDTLWG